MSAHFRQDPSHPDTGDYGRENAYYQASRHAHATKKHGPSRRAFIAGGVVIAAVAAVGVATPAMAGGVIDEIKNKAFSVSDLLSQTLDAFKAFDFNKAHDLSLQTSAEIGELQKQINGGLWDAAQMIPVLGDDVKAARTLIDMLGRVVDEGLTPMTETLTGYSLDTLIHKNEFDQNQIDLATLQVLVGAVKQAMPVLSDAVDTLDGIGTLHIPQLAQVVDSAKEKVSPLAGKMDMITELLDVVPNMLGAAGDRVYVVMAMNNVEIRAMGGFVGQCCRVSVSNGTIALGDVRAIYDYINGHEEDCVPLTDEEVTLYTDSVGYMAGNTCSIPDFPRVCDIWSQLWLNFQGESVDGIIALDPVLLQMLMALTGGAYMTDGTLLDGNDTVRVLLHDTYWKYMDDTDAMDAYFSEAASTALDCIMLNVASMSLPDLARTVSDAVDQYHLFAWFANEQEQQVIDGLGASGAVKLDPATPELGVYVDNMSWSKMEWWLDLDFTIGDAKPNLDGSKSYDCTLTFSNAATWDEINVCNDYMVGTNPEKFAADDILERLTIFAPAGGSVAVTDHNDFFVPWDDATYKGLQVVTGRIHNEIEAPATLSFTVTTSPQANEDLTVRVTPAVQNYR